MSRIKLKDNVKIVAALPTADQTEIDLTGYIGQVCEVVGHWKQVDNSFLAKGEVQVNLNGEGTVNLNKGEYEVVL